MSGATATSSANAERVLLRVAASRAPPTANRNVTAAASQKLPTRIAPMAATETNRSMLMCLTISDRKALMAMGRPATTAAASMRMLPTVVAPSLSAMREATMATPEMAGTAQRPWSQVWILFMMRPSG